MRDIKQNFRSLVKDERGNVLITFVLTSTVAIAAVGGALDFGRANHERTKMQNVLDASLVSGIAKYRETNDWAAAKTEAEAIFNATFTNSITPTTQNPNPVVALDQPKVTITYSGNVLTGNASMTVSTPFINMVFGRNMSTLVAGSSIPATSRQLEVAVMVDLTGSMGSTTGTSVLTTSCSTVPLPLTKIDYLKCAGEDLLNILLPANGSNSSTVRVGVAPFADYVNAGPYVDEVTGLASTGGTYSNIANLASTKQGPFTGSYSGTSTTGSQFGAMGALTTVGSVVTGAGATYSNGYCSTPSTTGTVPVTQYQGRNAGEGIAYYYNNYYNSNSSNYKWRGAAPTGLLRATLTSPLSYINNYNNGWTYYSGAYTDDYYYAPLVTNTTGLTVQTRTAYDSSYGNKTGNIGASISINNGTPPSPALKASTSPGGGYWNVYGIQTDGTLTYYWVNSGYYVPLYTTLTTTSVVAGCESTVVAQPSSKLISCVTERLNGTDLDYTADAPASNRYIGSYNHGTTSKSNYSSDGKCWVAGRELPQVIPLTNNRDTIASFFTNATVGGATPGHLGTAWASYLLSPSWSNIWPADSAPSAYNSTNIKKAAILMTDGEYNLQFSTGTGGAVSAKQALMLCKQMRDNGIAVYTVGFGFASNATPPTPNVEAMSVTDRTTPLAGSATAQQKALDTLAKCASSNSSYFFPYDGEALRTVFKTIASSLTATTSSGSGRITQ